MIVGSRISIGLGIEEGKPCPCQGAPKAAVSLDTLSQGRASGKTALGAPCQGQGSTSSMPGPMAMRLPTIVDHL